MVWWEFVGSNAGIPKLLSHKGWYVPLILDNKFHGASTDYLQNMMKSALLLSEDLLSWVAQAVHKLAQIPIEHGT